MWNARLDESQAGTKIAGRNINNLRYTYHSIGINWIKNKENLGEGKRGKWKNLL